MMLPTILIAATTANAITSGSRTRGRLAAVVSTANSPSAAASAAARLARSAAGTTRCAGRWEKAAR